MSRDIRSANERIDGEVLQLLQESEGQLPLHTPFAALLATTRTSHVSKEERAQKGMSSFGLQFEKSTEFIQKVWKRIKHFNIIIIDFVISPFKYLTALWLICTLSWIWNGAHSSPHNTGLSSHVAAAYKLEYSETYYWHTFLYCIPPGAEWYTGIPTGLLSTAVTRVQQVSHSRSKNQVWCRVHTHFIFKWLEFLLAIIIHLTYIACTFLHHILY